MREASRKDQERPRERKASVCRHRWLIEPPNGPTSRGRCRLCGKARRFRTVVEGTWFSELPPKDAA